MNKNQKNKLSEDQRLAWKQVSAVLMETLEKQIGRVFGDRQIIRGLRPDNRIEAGTEIAIRVSASKREIEIARGFDSDVI